MSAWKTPATDELQTKSAESSRGEIENSTSTSQKLRLVDPAYWVRINCLPLCDNHGPLSRLAITACYQSIILDVHSPLSTFIIRSILTFEAIWTGVAVGCGSC